MTGIIPLGWARLMTDFPGCSDWPESEYQQDTEIYVELVKHGNSFLWTSLSINQYNRESALSMQAFGTKDMPTINDGA